MKEEEEEKSNATNTQQKPHFSNKLQESIVTIGKYLASTLSFA